MTCHEHAKKRGARTGARATISDMEPKGRSVIWEAPEHHHIEKSSDWYWALGILTIAAAVTALFLGNLLFGMLILIGGGVLSVAAAREPQDIMYAVTARGVRVGNELFPYSTLESFYIDEDNPLGPQLLIKSKRKFMPLIVIPLPDDAVDEVDDLIGERLPEEELEEPFLNKLLEFLGF